MADSSFDIGKLVVDREERLPAPAVIVSLPTTPASEWITYGGTTVAQDNPGYPADAPVVIVVDAADSDTYLPKWDAETPLSQTDLDKMGVYYTAVPAPRLTSADTDDDGDCDTDTATDAA